MLRLRAIKPNRLRVVDRQRVHRRLRARDGHEAGEEALHGRLHVVDGHARIRERRLHDGVVLGVELELHHRAGGRFEAVGREDQGAVLVGDFDDLHADHAGATRHARGRGGLGGGHDGAAAAGVGHGGGGGAGAVAVLGEGGEREGEEGGCGEEMHDEPFF